MRPIDIAVINCVGWKAHTGCETAGCEASWLLEEMPGEDRSLVLLSSAIQERGGQRKLVAKPRVDAGQGSWSIPKGGLGLVGAHDLESAWVGWWCAATRVCVCRGTLSGES